MSLYRVTSFRDDSVVVSQRWREEVLRPSTCRACWVLLPHLRGAPMDMHLERAQTVHGNFLLAKNILGGPRLISQSLAEVLDRYLRLFVRGHLYIGQERCEQYVTLTAMPEAYMAWYDDETSPHSKVYPCPTCGRRCEMLVGQKYFDAACVRPGLAYSSCSGTSLIVDEAMLKLIRSVCKERLSIEEIRPGPPPSWGDRPWPPPMTHNLSPAAPPLKP